MTNGKSDKVIAEMFGVCRTAVSKFRKDHGIPTRQYTGEIGEHLVAERLSELGFNVVNMNSNLSKTFPFDLLVNRTKRIDVKSALSYKGRWSFGLTSKDGDGIKGDNGTHTQLLNGRWKKDFSKTCDFLILCGIDGGTSSMFIIPSFVGLPNTINIPIGKDCRWYQWINQWNLISKIAA